MLKQLKKAALNGAMKVMSHPGFGKVMSDPRVMNALTRTFEVVGQVRGRMDESLKDLAERLNLATKDDVSALSQKLGEVETSVDQIEARLETEPAPRARKKKADPA
jgi:hypothetical protein